MVGAPHHSLDTDAGLYAMWVAPQHRRAGVAAALVEAVVTWARAAGFRRLRLEVADANEAAVRLYERMGFAPTGRTDHRPHHETTSPSTSLPLTSDRLSARTLSCHIYCCLVQFHA